MSRGAPGEEGPLAVARGPALRRAKPAASAHGEKAPADGDGRTATTSRVAVPARLATGTVDRMKRRPRGLYFHLILGFPQRPWIELAVGMRRRSRLVTHHVEFPRPATHWEPYVP